MAIEVFVQRQRINVVALMRVARGESSGDGIPQSGAVVVLTEIEIILFAGEEIRGLRQAVRDSARALLQLDVARGDRQVRGRIAATLRARPHLHWPDGTPARALRVLDSADEVAAILTAAEQDAPGGARTAPAATARDELLRPLWTAVRTARRAAVEEAVRVITARRAAS